MSTSENPKWVPTAKRFVVFLDIMGFKDFVNRNSHKVVYEKLQILSNSLDYLDISNAITAVYLTANDSLECKLVEKLIDDAIPVKYLHFQNVSGKCIPRLSHTKRTREELLKAKTNPDNVLVSLSQDAELKYKQMLESEKR